MSIKQALQLLGIFIIALGMVSACAPSSPPPGYLELQLVMTDSINVPVLGMYDYSGNHRTYYSAGVGMCLPESFAAIGQDELAMWDTGTCSWDVIGRNGIGSGKDIRGKYAIELSPMSEFDGVDLYKQSSFSSMLDVQLISYDSHRAKVEVKLMEGPYVQHYGYIDAMAFFRIGFPIPSVQLKQAIPTGEAVLGMMSYSEIGVHYLHVDGKCDPADMPDVNSTDAALAIWNTESCTWTYWNTDLDHNLQNGCVIGQFDPSMGPIHELAWENYTSDMANEYADCLGTNENEFRLIAFDVGYALSNGMPMLIVLSSDKRWMAVTMDNFFPCSFYVNGVC